MIKKVIVSLTIKLDHSIRVVRYLEPYLVVKNNYVERDRIRKEKNDIVN